MGGREPLSRVQARPARPKNRPRLHRRELPGARGRDLLAACERALGIAAGLTTADGAVTLEEMDCAFACSVAPVVEVDHAYRGRVTPGDVDSLLSAPAHAGHREEASATIAPA